jgi:hypothetical protein
LTLEEAKSGGCVFVVTLPVHLDGSASGELAHSEGQLSARA